MKYVKQKKLGFIISAILGAQAVYALPQGAQVVQGSASFSVSNGSTMNITNSNNAVINWQQFNIGAGQTTNFIQPNSASSVLNRVISNNPSQILGNLNSNGQVFLINQHGILVGEGARINTNGFFASTLNITNENFLNGNLAFSEGGLGDINNKGYIHAGDDGNVVLIAPNIENGGVIEVDNGNIILAAGESITITSLDNSNVEFQVQAPKNSVTNLGSVIAKNGAASLFAGTLKHSGIIRATGLVRDKNGKIRLVALDRVEVSGSVDVSGEKAGNIEILGNVVDIQGGANINASGSINAGEILIGGDQQGLNPDIKNATSTTVALGAQVKADGLGMADGGRVIVFAANDVHIHGDISATGGVTAGDGGFIETSGLKQLDITAIPSAAATNGEAGEWLIDPNNITIQSTAGIDTNIVTATVGAGTLYDSNNDAAILSTETIVAALDQGTNVTISTQDQFDQFGNSTSLELGNININGAINSLAASLVGDLTLSAHNDINLNANITSASFNGLNITLNANSDALGGGSINLANATIDTDSANITLNGDAINVIGNAVIDNVGGTVALGSQLVIDAASSLTLGGGFSAGSILTVQGSIINNGALTAHAGCLDACGSVNFLSSVTNNGAMTFGVGNALFNGNLINNAAIDLLFFNPSILEKNNIQIGTAAPSIFSLNSGSTISDVSGSTLEVGSLGSLDVNTPITLPSNMILSSTGGTFNNFQSLTLPRTFNLTGGTINFNQGTYGLYDSALYNMNIAGGAGVDLIFNGASPGYLFLYTGNINWNSSGGNIILNNTYLNVENFFIKNSSSLAGISDTNGSIDVIGGGRFEQNSANGITTTIATVFNNYGSIVLGGDGTSISSTLAYTYAIGAAQQPLTLKNGGSLTGTGIFQGSVNVDAGGAIAPGVSGYGKDNTGLLQITGNVALNAKSISMFEIDAASNGLAGTYDQLAVTGNISFDPASQMIALWDNVTAQPLLTNQSPFTLISWTGAVSGTGYGAVIDPLLVPSSTKGISGSNYGYLPVALSGASQIVFWDHGAATNNWEDALNWSTNVVPQAAENLVVEFSQVDINAATSAIGNSQFDGDVRVYGTGNLISNGNLYAISNLSIETSTASISGAGTLLNFNEFDTLNAFDPGAGLALNVENNGSMKFGEVLSTTRDFAFSNASYVNNGNLRFLTLSLGNEIDFSAVAGGLVNDGRIAIVAKDTDVRFLGALSNNDELSLFSANNNNSKLTFANSNTNNGTITLIHTQLGFDSGVTYTLGSGTIFDGGNLSNSILNIGNGVVLDIQTPLNLAQYQSVTLNGGLIDNAQNLTLNDNFIWSSGVVKGNGTFTTTGFYGVTSLGSGSDTILQGVSSNLPLTWKNDGHVDWLASGGDFVINNAIFTNSPLALGTFSIKTTSNNSGIIGNGTFNNQGHMEVNAATTATITDIGVTFNHSAGGIQTGLELLVSGHTLSLSGTTNVTGFGEINFAPGSVLSIVNGGILNLNSTTVILGSSPSNFAGPTAGSLNIETGGTLNVLQTPSIFNIYNVLNLNGGTLDITNNLPLPNIMNWAGGKISGSGTLIVPAATTVNITASNSPVALDAVSLINNGTMTYSASNDLNDLYLNNAATLTNAGTFNFQNSTGGADVSSNVGVEGSFINSGIINVAQPSSTNNIDFWVPFTSSGIINIADGKFFELNDASVLSGAVNTNNSGAFSIGSSGVGVLTLSGTPSISGSGFFKIGSSLGSSVPSIFDVTTSFLLPAAMTLDLHRGGEIRNASNLLVPNSFNWTGGKIIGSGIFTIPAATIVNMTGTTGDMYIDGSTPNTVFTLVNNGTVNFTSANSSNDFRVDNKAVWINKGILNLMNASNGASITGLSGANGSFVNDTTGVINSAPSATLNPALSVFIPFDNKGTINVASNTAFETNDIIADSGTIVIGSGGVFQIDRNVNSQGISNSRLTLSGTPSILGTGAFVVDDGAFFDVAVPMIFGSNLTLTLQGTGEIQNANNLTPPNTFNWNGGTVSGISGQVFTASASSTINMNAAVADMTLSAVDMVTNGIVNYSSNNKQFILSNNASWTNAGTLNIPTNANVTEISSTNSSLVNSGILNYSGAALMSIATDFVSTGVLNINSGAIELPSTATFSGDTIIASGSILGFSGGAITDVSILSGAKFSGLGSIVSTANVLIAESVTMPQRLTVNGGAVSFEGAATLSTLNLNLGVINVDTLGASSVGDVLTVVNLNWSSGAISGDGSASLVTSGDSSLLSGNLINIDWSNQGKLVWQGTDAEVLSMSNASLTNESSGVINIRNVASVNLNAGNNSGQLKSISSGSGVFVNDGALNLINANLNLNGLTLLLDSNTSVLNGSGTITGNVVNLTGLVTIGNPLDLSTSGAMIIDGNYTQGANGALEIRIVDPVNGQFSFDTFAVNGAAKLDGELRIAYYSNQFVSITESFNPFNFANRNGEFSSLVDSNGSILAIDFSNGGFTILGTSSLLTDAVTIQTILQNQDKVERLVAIIEKEELSESLAFIDEITKEADEDEKKAKKRGPRLVCR